MMSGFIILPGTLEVAFFLLPFKFHIFEGMNRTAIYSFSGDMRKCYLLPVVLAAGETALRTERSTGIETVTISEDLDKLFSIDLQVVQFSWKA